MTTAIIVQARMGSSRLPGKVMLDLAGKPVLQHVLERCRRIASADVVVCAIAQEPTNGPLIETARAAGAEVHVGSVHDVLLRYHGAARAVGATSVVRVTSDCPLIDPEICDSVIARRVEDNADYASNLTPRSYPKGLDCECFSVELLEQAASAATESFEREHVTQWMVRAPTVRKVNVSSGDLSLASQRWTLDYPEDLEFLRGVARLLPLENATFPQLLDAIRAHPDLQSINAGLTEKPPSSENRNIAL